MPKRIFTFPVFSSVQSFSYFFRLLLEFFFCLLAFCEVVRERNWCVGQPAEEELGARLGYQGDISLHISMFSLAKLDLCFCCSPRICIFNVHLCLCVKMPHGTQKGNSSPSTSTSTSPYRPSNSTPFHSRPGQLLGIPKAKSPTAAEAA